LNRQQRYDWGRNSNRKIGNISTSKRKEVIGKKAEKKIGQKEKWLEYQPIRGGVLS